MEETTESWTQDRKSWTQDRSRIDLTLNSWRVQELVQGLIEGQRSTMAVGLGRLNVAAVTRRLVCRHHADLHPTCGLLPAPGPVGAAALATEDRGESPDDPPPVASWP